jgi:hypothetical protein
MRARVASQGMKPLFAIGGWAGPLLGWLDPWEIAAGALGVVLGLLFLRHIAEHWTRKT